MPSRRGILGGIAAIFATGTGKLFAVDRKSGQIVGEGPVWTAPEGEKIIGLQVFGGELVIATDKRVLALDFENAVATESSKRRSMFKDLK